MSFVTNKTYSFQGFTLIELMVGVTISMILMVSVGVFVSGGMQNIFLQQRVFKNSGDFVTFNTKLHSSFVALDTNLTPHVTSHSMVFKADPVFWDWGFTYIGTGSQDNYYCSGSEDAGGDSTQHLYIKSFIPYFEAGETDFSDIARASNSGYISDVKQHIVTDSVWDLIIGQHTFGDRIWSTGTGTFLNSPTGLVLDADILYVSDTLNDRILYYHTTTHDIWVLLDANDGLDEPTGLRISADWSLLIANSAKGEILEYSSLGLTSNPNLAIDFEDPYTATQFTFQVLQAGSPVNIAWLWESNISIDATSDDYFDVDGENRGRYWWVDYGPSSSQSWCSWAGKEIINGRPVSCQSSWTWATSTDSPFNITTANIDLSWLGVFSAWAYYAQVELLDAWWTSLLEKHIPYFVQWDNDLLTTGDNALEVLATGLSYPYRIDGDNIPADVVAFDLTEPYNYAFDARYDSILPTPVFSFEPHIGGWFINIQWEYYKNYDCYDSNTRITREFIWKKNIP